jgi:hypothetical protein
MLSAEGHYGLSGEPYARNKTIYNEPFRHSKTLSCSWRSSMAYQVLATKLYNPPIQSGLVRRKELVQRLENGYLAGKRITLVSAPAGFGKTTIISEWITTTEPGKSFGWVSLMMVITIRSGFLSTWCQPFKM